MTHCDRILALLETGPKTADQLYRQVYSVVHSRISDLRRRGYDIRCDRVPGQTGARSYLYTLVGSLDPAPVIDPAGVGSSELEQLRLEAA